MSEKVITGSLSACSSATATEIEIAKEILTTGNLARFEQIRYDEKQPDPMKRHKDLLKPGIDAYAERYMSYIRQFIPTEENFINCFFPTTKDIINPLKRLVLLKVNETPEFAPFISKVEEMIDTICMRNTFVRSAKSGDRKNEVRKFVAGKDERNKFLLTQFLLLQLSKSMIVKEDDSHNEWNRNIGTVFSNGGRVLTILPAGFNKNCFIGKTFATQLKQRFATHGINQTDLSEEKRSPLQAACTGVIQFISSYFSLHNATYENFGINLAIGGNGQEAPCKNAAGEFMKITEEGNWGHMLWGFLSGDDDSNSAILMGLESDEAGKTSF